MREDPPTLWQTWVTLRQTTAGRDGPNAMRGCGERHLEPGLARQTRKRIGICLTGLLTCAGAPALSDAIAQDQFNSGAWTAAEGVLRDAAAHLTLARYTNRDPGDYASHVIASNSDFWNTAGALTRFTIYLAFHQTKRTYAFCVLVCMTLLTLLYRIRMKQIHSQVRSRLEERLAERERIARELHDTLLQGVQGLILRFQAAADIMPAHEPARCAMARILERADNLLDQSRARIKDLRDPASARVALPEALATEGEQLKSLYEGEVIVSAVGVHRDLHPIVREEALLIGREALVNASRHAHATRIEAELFYGDTGLRMRIRDNGGGIDPFVLHNAGLQGRWGLLGMRERAKKLSARLEIWSTAGAGTEIDLHVPAAVAYGEFWRPARPSWWRRGDRSLFEDFR
jgi:signal transduction histidine kinase